MYKYASDSMNRITKLVNYLETIEDLFYSRYSSSKYIDPDLALSIISSIQNSINNSVNILTKLTNNDTLMNLVLDIKQINTTINTNKSELDGNTDTTKILPKESRSKLTSVFSRVLEELNNTKDSTIDDIVDAEIVDNKEES